MHLHPLHLPHPGRALREPGVLRHDARVAAELALVAVGLGVTVPRLAAVLHDRTAAAPSTGVAAATAPATGTVAVADVPALTLVADGAAVAARVHLPEGATGRVRVVDASGTAVADVALVGDAVEVRDVAPGTYSLVLQEEGPVEVIGDAAVSSATVLRTGAFRLDPGATVRVVVDRG